MIFLNQIRFMIQMSMIINNQIIKNRIKYKEKTCLKVKITKNNYLQTTYQDNHKYFKWKEIKHHLIQIKIKLIFKVLIYN